MPLSKEKMREYNRKYRESHKEYFDNYMTEWRKTHADKSRYYVQKGYCYKKQAQLLRNIDIA